MMWLMILAGVVGALVWGLVFDHLDRRKNRAGEHKTADQILDSLASYCQRINDSGH